MSLRTHITKKIPGLGCYGDTINPILAGFTTLKDKNVASLCAAVSNHRISKRILESLPIPPAHAKLCTTLFLAERSQEVLVKKTVNAALKTVGGGIFFV